MIQFWHGIDCHVLCVMVFTIACKYLRLRELMYKAPPASEGQGNVFTGVLSVNGPPRQLDKTGGTPSLGQVTIIQEDFLVRNKFDLEHSIKVKIIQNYSIASYWKFFLRQSTRSTSRHCLFTGTHCFVHRCFWHCSYDHPCLARHTCRPFDTVLSRSFYLQHFWFYVLITWVPALLTKGYWQS